MAAGQVDLCLLDESRIERGRQHPFLVTGGLVLPFDSLARLDEELVRIREAAGYPSSIPLKWNAPGAQTVAAPKHASAKEELLRATHSAGGRLFVTLVHCDIAKGVAAGSQDVRFGWNTVLASVEKHLEARNRRAIVVADRPSGGPAYAFLEEKAIDGLIYPARGKISQRTKPLSRMVGFASTTAVASRISSTMDVAIGGFAFALNAPQGGGGKDLGREVAGLIRPLLESVDLRPLLPKAEYTAPYSRMVARLRQVGLRS